MKRTLSLLLASTAILIAGCSTTETTEEGEQPEEEAQTEELTDVEKQAANTLLLKPNQNAGSVNPEDQAEVTAMLPMGEPDDSPTIQAVEQILAINPNFGIDGQFLFGYTGGYMQSPAEDGDDTIVFYVLNKTGQPLNNFSFIATFTVHDEVVFEDLEIVYDSELMGELPNNTIMPISVPTSQENREVLESATSENDYTLTADHFDGDLNMEDVEDDTKEE